eukprot:TRINITY_DN42684_c0_g1_i1.p1 TRINITY_DN42684_c0_g1~~TRINITY_DN42684_c0_g1_i1.p1  ORF type:complete len:875 (+),score=127.20 TRINITY_DN42684_c0_g1_i1:73-2697(+)
MSRPPRGKLPSHKPLSRPEDRERPFAHPRRDPRLGPTVRCLSRGARRGAGLPPARAAADSVAAREAALRRIVKASEAYADATWSFAEVRRELVDALLHVRSLSLEVVESIERWRANSGRGNAPWPDPSTGENYLLKMKSDTSWLSESPLGDLLQFSPKSDPFFVVPSARLQQKTPSNMMTPTLRARTQQGGDQQRRAVLPLQTSLLKRIREAELLILKESVQARLQQAAADGATVRAEATRAAAAAEAASHAVTAKMQHVSARELAALAPRSDAVASKPPIVEADADIARANSLLANQAAGLVSSPFVVTGPLPVAPLPEGPADSEFWLQPVGVTSDEMQGLFDTYIPRIDERLARTMDGWKALGTALREEGPGATEWYWLQSDGDKNARGVSSRGTALKAVGLVVYRVKKMSTSIGQLLHVSTVDLTKLPAVLEAVKTHMFTRLPIKSIRSTLWYIPQESGTLQLSDEIHQMFKGAKFKWFQLTNASGVRGQVMQSPRYPPPDSPPMPEDTLCIKACAGQVWLRDGVNSSTDTRRIGHCPLSLSLGAACLRQLWNRSPEAKAANEAAAVTAAAAALVRSAAREGLVRALLSGNLDRRLAATCTPVSLQDAADGASGINAFGCGETAEQRSISMLNSLTRSLETRSGGMPAIMCECSEDDVASLVKQGVAAGYADACTGLQVDTLPDELGTLHPQDAAFGRLFITVDFAACTMLPGGDLFEVPVHAVGICPSHNQPVVYLRTSEDDVFVVVTPCSRSVSEHSAFATYADILKHTEPLDPAPYVAVRLSSLSARQAVRTWEVADANALGIAGSASLHVAEFGSLAVCAGRPMPGILRPVVPEPSKVLDLHPPFLLALWHTNIEDLGVPLVCTLVT